MSSADGSRHDEHEYGRAVQALLRRRRVVAASGLLLVLVAVGVCGVRGKALAAWLRGEADLTGRPRFEPPHPTDPAALAEIDLGRVHADLLPGWVEAVAAADSPASRAREARAFEALLDEAGVDPNLAALLRELRARVTSSPVANWDRIAWLMWAWNDYLDRHALPWRIEGGVRPEGSRGVFYAKTYRAMDEVKVAVGGGAYRTRFVERTDWTNVVEAYLGESSRDEGGALVVVDRVRDFAVERVWPLLDPNDDPYRAPVDRAFAAAVRAEAEAALPEASLAVLRETAPAHWTVREAIAAIHMRHECGSDLVVEVVPWKGLPAEGRALLRRTAVRDARRGGACPDVTPDEARALSTASEELERARGLEAALGGLVAWLARGVAVHETRHAADERAAAASLWDGALGGGGPACSGCDAALDGATRGELSAYLASFATVGTGYASLFQACEMEGTDGPHGLALAAVEARLLPGGCAGAPPADLYAQAGVLDEALFARAAPVSFPAGYPAVLDAFHE
ncbi:MAG TPA: hypothetical protein VG389_05955 [Myxococcota bacterium]|nr:hypothetical protein [Myxococcota bacterium]